MSPLLIVTQAPSVPGPAAGRRKSGRWLVLSVDDDPINQLVIQSLLPIAEYEVRRFVQLLVGPER